MNACAADSEGGGGSPGRPGSDTARRAAGRESRPAPGASSAFRIEGARGDDVPMIAALLRAAELPHEDFAAHVAHFLVAHDAHGAVVGAVGAEVCGTDALLRSLVVAPPQRGAGLGHALVEQLEEVAGAWGVRRWWLLTTTARRFFEAGGFAVAERASAPDAIRATGQFNGGCCCSAVCLTRERRGAAR